MSAIKVQFNRPATLETTLKDGTQKSDTFGKGVHNVDAEHKDNWYLAALIKDGDAVVVGEAPAGKIEPKGDDLLEGNVGDVKAKLEAAELSLEQLLVLKDAEEIGKNRAGVLSAIEALAAKAK